MHRLLILVIILYLAEAVSMAQPPDTVMNLREVKIEGSRLESFNIGNKVDVIPVSLLRSERFTDVGQILSGQTLLSINSYGNTGLANAQFRGTSSNHTAVLWNGLNIQAPNDGGVNFTWIPGNFIDQLKIQYGGAGALFGSGAIGGVIHLDNKAYEYNKGLSCSMSARYASFHDFMQTATVEYSGKMIVSRFRMLNHSSENDFPFENTALYGSPLMRMSNSSISRRGFLQDNYIKTGKNSELSSAVWMQANSNEIPSPMTALDNNTWQKDNFGRATLAWKYNHRKINFNMRQGGLYYNIHYEDPDMNLVSEIISRSSITEAEVSYTGMKKTSFNFGLNNTFDQVETGNYVKIQSRDRFAAFASGKIKSLNGSCILISAREEIIEGEETPVTWSVSGLLNSFPEFNLKAIVSRNYRVPTFNELYWAIWGNPDLKPEKGFNEEASIEWKNNSEDSGLNFTATIFNSSIQDWIIWLPYGSIWKPQNVKKVWSRGIEADGGYRADIGKTKLVTKINYAYTKTTNSEYDKASSSTIGKQLIYVPEHKASTQLSVIHENLRGGYSHRFVSRRFTDVENTQSINGYMLADLDISYSICYKKYNIMLSGGIHNIWDADYQVMAWYAMPGRSYYSRISISYNNKKQ